VTDLERALAFADAHAHEALALLRRWVEQDSFTGSADDVNAMGALLREAFALPALEVERRPSASFGEHLCFRTRAWDAEPDRRVLLVGHHDTVFPPGTFSGWREDGELAHGPGTLDMKGGIATVHGALSALASVGALDTLPLAFVSVADEEVGSPDSRPFTAQWARGARAALVFEAGRATDAIITARKGTGSVTARATGKAAHAGNAHADGVNAIWALSRFVDAAQSLTDYDAGITVNVGTISGGTSKNTVPASAECVLDFRVVRARDGARVMSALERLAREVASGLGARLELEGGVRRPPLERTEASAALAARYGEAARQEGLGGDESPLIGGGSDANDVASLGVPAIDGLGPRGHGFHTHDEHIQIGTLRTRTRALIRFLSSW
jgi:glutamate carboxypeptidase